MIKAIALDDEPPALEVLKKFATMVEDIDLIKTYTKTADALKYLEKFPVDLLFLDINMPSISGLEFSKKIPDHTIVIFVTAHSQFAVEGFNLNAIDYLLKPFTIDRFLQAVNKVKRHITVSKYNEPALQEHILLRSDYSLVKVFLEDMLFIESMGDYVRIHQTTQKPLVIRMTMKILEEKLPSSHFIRVHRSFIVSMRKIESVRNKNILIRQHEIPIGALFEESFFKKFGPYS